MRNEREIWLTKHTGDLLGALVIRDPDGVMEAFDQINGGYGNDGIFSACYSAAEIIRRVAFPNIKRGNGKFTGGMMAVQRDPRVNVRPEMLWAAQFFAAYCNGDDDTTQALFSIGEKDPDSQAQGVVSLMGMCADVLRDEMDL